MKFEIPDEKINHLQVATLERLCQRAKAAHHVDILFRINGKDEHYQADWLKHISILGQKDST